MARAQQPAPLGETARRRMTAEINLRDEVARDWSRAPTYTVQLRHVLALAWRMGDHWPVIVWEFSDAWFATAVAIQDTPSDLAGVIAAGDALNHAIFTCDEIQQVVRRLLGASLLWVSDDGRFGLTPSGRALLEGAGVAGCNRSIPFLSCCTTSRSTSLRGASPRGEVRCAWLIYMQGGDPDTRGP